MGLVTEYSNSRYPDHAAPPSMWKGTTPLSAVASANRQTASWRTIESRVPATANRPTTTVRAHAVASEKGTDRSAQSTSTTARGSRGSR